ncbi:MAG: hypothetical protein COU33_02005 [Candidatus Magasanikbacteria bacterium CG10_big_fil_rev_8_21_14_0_10_43_6]|uniref:Prepilin peptidase n=1 Tax=Candidatus Magasanikbacteria bacterium CG10_big_fil_rev_8_21_14_0_10_43_6 TaxID=1974650 RepID=A0A2M6W1G1_9BACT|nr:MAG: hypothetical protein COU33_02005 [Candidatus Magasanikbacteria bacterium CG10_big_fil_rev_8_21_14_0_10_43_6]
MGYILFAIGLLCGSFLNAWVWRTRAGISVVRGRSLCPHCKKTIAWFDNMPVLSFLILQGKCRACRASISWQYPVVEVVMGLLFASLAFFYSSVNVSLVRDACLVFVLVAVFVYDFLYKEIWDRWTTIPAALFALDALIRGSMSWQSMGIGIAIAAGFFLLQYVVSHGKWIGGGDIRLGVFMGVVLGWPGILVALMLAYISGAAVSIFLIFLKKKALASETPFGTYLAVATLVTYFYGMDMLAWYLRLL